MSDAPWLRLPVADLNAFRVVARERSLTLAARRLHTSQSALSRRMRKLEDALQVCLFERGVHGVVPTESGRKLLRHVDTLCLHEEELIAELRGRHPFSLHGVLRVAAAGATLHGVVLPALAPLLRENPGARLEFHALEGARQQRWLGDARVDLAVSAQAVARRGCVATRLGGEVFLLVESRALRGGDAVYLDTGSGEESHERCLAALSLPAQRRILGGDALTLAAGAAQGLGRALVPLHALHAGQELRRVAGVLPLVCERFVHHGREARHPRLVTAVLDALIASAPALLCADPAALMTQAR